MGYVLPTFNLLFNAKKNAGTFISPVPPVAPFRLTNQPCALVWGRRVAVGSTGGTTQQGVLTQGISLLVGPRTDVRSPACIAGEDCLEVPAGTGRWYQVMMVDDIGRGWPNEHRSALLLAILATWPAPIP